MKEFYPTQKEVNEWIDRIWAAAESTEYMVECVENAQAAIPAHFYDAHALGRNRFYRFLPKGRDPFYIYWQPDMTGPSPLCVHVPGYGCEICAVPEIASQGYNVMEVAPWGLVTPDGFTPKRETNSVLPETIKTLGEGGYFEWLEDCVIATLWAWKQPEVLPNRVSFFGTSQGGGTALLLGSLFKDHGVRCVAADQPFLTNFPLANCTGAYELLRDPLEETIAKHGEEKTYKALGLVDSISHAFRMEYPVLLTSGSTDTVCPENTVKSLFEMLPFTRCYMDIDGRVHGFTPEFARLALAWFRMYA